MTKISAGSSTSCPGTPQGSTVKGSGVSAAVTASPAAGGSGAAQQILVFSPTAHSTQLNSQPLLILSPLNQKGGSQQLQQTTGAIQTTQQVNIIPPTRETGVAQLHSVAVNLQSSSSQSSTSSSSSGSESSQNATQTSAAAATTTAKSVLTTSQQLTTSTATALATIPAATAPTVFQFLPNTPTTITVPSVPSNNSAINSSSSASAKTVTSHITSTVTSQGQVSVQVQHTPANAKSKVKATSTPSSSSTQGTTQTTPSVSSATKAYSGPILTKENAHSLLSEQFNSRRSLLFDKKTSVSSPSSDCENTTTKKKPVATAAATSQDISVVKAINGTQVLKMNDTSPISKLLQTNCKDNNSKAIGSPVGGIKSPLAADKPGTRGSRLVSKTVSSLLKEQRGSSLNLDGKAAYVNDRRPVSELLRESRERQLRQLVNNVNATNPGTPTLSPTTAVMIQTLTVSKASSSSGVETSTAQATPHTSTPNTIYLKKNSSGTVTSASTPRLTTHHQGCPVHVISIPRSSGTIADDILSPNVSLAPKRVLSTEGGPRKRFCSGDGHYDILQTPHGTLEVLKTEAQS